MRTPNRAPTFNSRTSCRMRHRIRTFFRNSRGCVKPGGVYLGVAPEQNFTCISALQSKVVFILDIRQQNMIELLIYKALFEISADHLIPVLTAFHVVEDLRFKPGSALASGPG